MEEVEEDNWEMEVLLTLGKILLIALDPHHQYSL